MTEKDDGLNERQMIALDLVVSGLPDSEIAKRVGVSRQWVNTWRNHDSEFIYELALRRQAMREMHQDSLNELIAGAIQVVKEALDSPDEKTRFKAAALVLKVSGMQGYMKPDKQPSKEEDVVSILSSAIGEVAKDLGFV